MRLHVCRVHHGPRRTAPPLFVTDSFAEERWARLARPLSGEFARSAMVNARYRPAGNIDQCRRCEAADRSKLAFPRKSLALGHRGCCEGLDSPLPRVGFIGKLLALHQRRDCMKSPASAVSFFAHRCEDAALSVFKQSSFCVRVLKSANISQDTRVLPEIMPGNWDKKSRVM